MDDVDVEEAIARHRLEGCHGPRVRGQWRPRPVFSIGKAAQPAVDRLTGYQTLVATPVNFGDTISGSVSIPAETVLYTFTAEVGDTILIGMSRISGDLWPRFRLYDPYWVLLGDESSPVHAEITRVLPSRHCVYLPLVLSNYSNPAPLMEAKLQSSALTNCRSGTYSILVSDGFDGTLTGQYALYVQRLNSPANVTSLSYGQTVSGTIAMPAEMDTYTFTAGAGDTVVIGMSRVSGDLWQEIRLYDADGNLLNEDSGPVHAEVTQPLVLAGSYTILVGDGFDGTLTGDYNINLQGPP